MIVFLVIGGVISLASTAVGLAAVMHVVAQHFATAPRGLSEIFRFAFGHLVPLVLVTLLLVVGGIAFVIGFAILAVVPIITILAFILGPFALIYIGVRLALVYEVIIVERSRPVDAVKRNWALVEGTGGGSSVRSSSS